MALEALEAQLDTLKPADAPDMAPGNETVDSDLLQDATQMEIDPPEKDDAEEQQEDALQPQQANEEAITLLRLNRTYHLDAINFIKTIHEASENICQLLSSRNKSEVTEAMDFFKTVDAYRIETAQVSSLRMRQILCALYLQKC